MHFCLFKNNKLLFFLECGAIYTSPPFVPGGEKDSQYLYHPWHVGIYKKDSRDKMILTCSGTLITEYAVLTGKSNLLLKFILEF